MRSFLYAVVLLWEWFNPSINFIALFWIVCKEFRLVENVEDQAEMQ